MPTTPQNAQSQQHIHQEAPEQTASEADTQQSQPDAQAAQQADALDAVLDDVETSLQSNAEEYVNSFVQKGGQ